MLKRHLQEKKYNSLLNIINERLYFDMYEGVARNKQQIEATSGATLGEATRQGNYIFKILLINYIKYFDLYKIRFKRILITSFIFFQIIRRGFITVS